MERPQIIRKIGEIEEDFVVFMEDYVHSFLEGLKNTEIQPTEKVLFYGKTLPEGGKWIHIVYGAARVDGNDKETGIIFDKYEVIGSLNIGQWREETAGVHGILIGNARQERNVNGFYIFYDPNECMKEYLNRYYRRQISDTEVAVKSAEVCRLSLYNEKANAQEPIPDRIYDLIRAVVIFIFIILCAIAVNTINTSGKMGEFIKTAVQMSETMKDYDE